RCLVRADTTINVINEVYDQCEYLIDPHTACGVDDARQARQRKDITMIGLATAHPAKFPEAVSKAGQAADPALPHHMADLFEREERYTVLPQDLEKVQQFMAANLRR